MTHVLTINDNEDITLVDLLDNDFGIDLQSRQTSPQGTERYLETFRIFAGDSSTAIAIKNKAYALDQAVLAINKYSQSSAYNEPVWLFEKSESETVTTRRAVLFKATFQLTTEGAVTPFQLNNGLVGLLQLERGVWEERVVTTLKVFENNSPVVAFPPENTFGTTALLSGKTLDGRVKQIEHISTGFVNTTIIAAGIRGVNLGTTNYQNCLSLGSGLTNTPSANFTLVNNSECTEPVGQTNTYNMVQYNIYNGSHTHKLKLSEISASTLDSTNKDYVGEYDVYLRWANKLSASGEWTKITLSYGYEGSMISNEPVYTTEDAFPNAWYLYPMHLGKISIPTNPYKEGEGGSTSQSSTTLADFTIALTAELVVDQGNNTEFWADSLFLIPVNGIAYTTEPRTVTQNAIVDGIYNKPDGSYYALSSDKTSVNTTSLDMVIPQGGGVVSYYRLANYDLLNNPTFELELQYHNRFNTLSDG